MNYWLLYAVACVLSGACGWMLEVISHDHKWGERILEYYNGKVRYNRLALRTVCISWMWVPNDKGDDYHRKWECCLLGRNVCFHGERWLGGDFERTLINLKKDGYRVFQFGFSAAFTVYLSKYTIAMGWYLRGGEIYGVKKHYRWWKMDREMKKEGLI